MAVQWVPTEVIYPIVVAGSSAIYPQATAVSIVDGITGSPIGLLVSLTRTAVYTLGVVDQNKYRKYNP